MRHLSRWIPSTLATAALGLAAGCNGSDTGQDQRNGRGNGDERSATGPGSMGTNAAAPNVTVNGPGSREIIKNDTPPGVSAPYGGNGIGSTPPVDVSKGGGSDSGESNSGRNAGKDGTIGADATTNNAGAGKTNGGPGTGEKPK